MRRAAVEDQVHGVAELADDLRRVARLGQTGDVRGGRRQRPDGAGQRPGRVVVRHAQADRRRAAGQDVRQPVVRTPPEDDGQPARPAAGAERHGRRRDHGDLRGLRRIGDEQRDALVRRASLDPVQPLDAARRVERDGDPVDRVGRQRHDAARTEGRDGLGPAVIVVRHDPGGHAGMSRRACASAASRSDAARALAGRARTRDSTSRATPSSASG